MNISEDARSTVTAFEYCRLYTISQTHLKRLLGKRDITSDYILSLEELSVYPQSLKGRIRARGGKKKKKGSSKPNPWNPKNLKKRAWIVRKK